MTWQTLAAFVLFLVPLAYSPGPGNAFFAAIGASSGVRASLPALAGYHLATLVVTFAIGVGLGAAILSNRPLGVVLGVAGSLYVAWLGISFLRSALAPRGDHAPQSARRGIGFRDGAVVLLLNPKAYYIIGLVFTQYLTANADRIGQVAALTVVFTLNNLIAFIVWTIAGAALTRVFRGEWAGRWIDAGFGVILIGVGVWMGWGAIAA